MIKHFFKTYTSNYFFRNPGTVIHVQNMYPYAIMPSESARIHTIHMGKNDTGKKFIVIK